MKRFELLFAGSLLCSAFLCAVAMAEDAKPTVEAKEFREGTKVTIAGDAKQTNIEIRCDRGIDTCVLRRTGDHWPANLEFKLHLRGLESFKVTSGNATLEWSVASTGDQPASVNLGSGKREVTLTPDDPLFTLAKKVKEKEASYFLVPIPAKLLAANPEQVKVQWIDFYR
jgi:hypothetical protein